MLCSLLCMLCVVCMDIWEVCVLLGYIGGMRMVMCVCVCVRFSCIARGDELGGSATTCAPRGDVIGDVLGELRI